MLDINELRYSRLSKLLGDVKVFWRFKKINNWVKSGYFWKVWLGVGGSY